MSNEVYGYLEFSSSRDTSHFVKLLEHETGLGFFELSVEELFNYPESLLPKKENFSWCFLIGDKPEYKNATYLIDNMDYAPEAEIGFPHQGEERLKILANAIFAIVKLLKPSRIVIALTDSSQIKDIKAINVTNFFSLLKSDCRDGSPPDCIYDIKIDIPLEM